MNEIELQKIVAATVRKRRVELGLSQEGLADLCGLHRTYVGAIERAERNITLKTLSVVATALGTSPLVLLGSNLR